MSYAALSYKTDQSPTQPNNPARLSLQWCHLHTNSITLTFTPRLTPRVLPHRLGTFGCLECSRTARHVQQSRVLPHWLDAFKRTAQQTLVQRDTSTIINTITPQTLPKPCRHYAEHTHTRYVVHHRSRGLSATFSPRTANDQSVWQSVR